MGNRKRGLDLKGLFIGWFSCLSPDSCFDFFFFFLLGRGLVSMPIYTPAAGDPGADCAAVVGGSEMYVLRHSRAWGS